VTATLGGMRGGTSTQSGPAVDGGPHDWLAGCEGYRVDTPGGRLGFVDEIRRDPAGRPVELVVRAGMLGTHRLDVPVDEITAVVPSRKTVVVL
jgi:hypothetical protein